MAFSGFQDFNPDFSDALQRMIAARPGISIYSGYRSPERQAELFQNAIAKYGSAEKARHWVAPPGHSRHNMGIAADLAFASPEDKAWAHANAANFGLNFRMGHEPWHIELINGKSTPVGNDSGVPVANARPQDRMEAEQILANGQNSEALYNLPAGLPAGGAGSMQAMAAGPQDVQALASLITPNRQTRAAKAQQIFQRIQDYA
jgi:hypothetical protein